MKKGMGMIAAIAAMAGLGASAAQGTNNGIHSLPMLNAGASSGYNGFGGNGKSRHKRSNMNRYAHNAKLKRRMAA